MLPMATRRKDREMDTAQIRTPAATCYYFANRLLWVV
jgi:hypothetical protein